MQQTGAGSAQEMQEAQASIGLRQASDDLQFAGIVVDYEGVLAVLEDALAYRVACHHRCQRQRRAYVYHLAIVAPPATRNPPRQPPAMPYTSSPVLSVMANMSGSGIDASADGGSQKRQHANDTG